MARLSLFLLLLGTPLLACAQMIVGQDTLYGNEWIDYDKTYYRIDVAEDGIYRIPYAQLQSAGLPVGSTDARFYQLWSLGEQQPMYVSTPSGPLQPGDYLEFYGEQNRSQLDRFLFEDPSQMLNPYYSLYTDTLAYFLVVGDEVGVRYESVDNPGFDGDGEDWFWGEEVVSFEEKTAESYDLVTVSISGNLVDKEVYFSTYENEGFASALSNTHLVELDLASIYDLGPAVDFSIRVLSNNLSDSRHNLALTLNNEVMLVDSFGAQVFKDIQFSSSCIGRRYISGRLSRRQPQ